MPARHAKLAYLAPVLALSLAACGTATKLSQIGETPPMTTIQDPQQQPGYRPVSLPMPQPIVGERRPSSLWQAGSRAFFKDQRAGTTNMAIPQLYGLQSQIAKILPKAANVADLVDTSGKSSQTATTEVKREEQVNLQVAAEVTQVLPNGNLVVNGRQEIRVNFEVRELQIAGVIRPQDISSTNTINYFKLAEARISYGGRGQQTDMQQPRYGQQFLDIINPF